MPFPQRFLTYNGETKPLTEWAKQYGVPHGTIRSRLDLGWTIERALTTPVDRRFSSKNAGRTAKGIPRPCPKLKKHADGSAYVRWQSKGQRHWITFGTWGSKAATDGYRRFTLEWAEGMAAAKEIKAGCVVAELVELYIEHADQYYRKRGIDPSKKKFNRQSVGDWLDKELARRMHSIPAMGGTALKGKMAVAGIADTEIESSLETRRHYLAERLRPQYLSLSERDAVEGEVTATLHALRAQLDAGEIQDSGVEFHAKCITALQDLQRRLPTSRPVPLVFLLGCMYSIADRCTHRFRRATA